MLQKVTLIPVNAESVAIINASYYINVPGLGWKSSSYVAAIDVRELRNQIRDRELWFEYCQENCCDDGIDYRDYGSQYADYWF